MKTMIKNKKPLFEFAVLSDTHLMFDCATKRLEFESRRKQSGRLTYAMELIKQINPNFIVHLGDLLQDNPAADTFQQSMLKAKKIFDQYGFEMLYVAGNQDVGDKPDPMMPTNVVGSETLGFYEHIFGKSWYIRKKANVNFVILNALLLNTSLSENQQQKTWFEQTLARLENERKFLFLHIPPFLQDINEVSIGHYDNLADPDRTWLCDLIKEYGVEMMMSGHVHHQFFNKMGDTKFYIAPSTAFTRPTFPHMFCSGAPSEQGRDDVGKLGFYHVSVFAEDFKVEFIRTDGIDTISDYRPKIIVPQNQCGENKLGVTLKHPITEFRELPIAWPSTIRLPVRNDYPTLALLELGCSFIRCPIQEFADHHRVKCLANLVDHGVKIAVCFFAHEFDLFSKLFIENKKLIHAVELQCIKSRSENIALLKKVDGRVEKNISIIDPKFQVPNKQLLRTRYGYTRNEILELDQQCGDAELKIDRVLCHDVEIIEDVDDFAEFMKRLSNIAAVDFIFEGKTLDDSQLTKDLTRTYFMIHRFADSRLYVDPLIDMDRSMDVTHGLLDTHCNPRPQFLALKSLMSLLQSVNIKKSSVRLEIGKEYENITCSTVDGGSVSLLNAGSGWRVDARSEIHCSGLIDLVSSSYAAVDQASESPISLFHFSRSSKSVPTTQKTAT